MGLFKNWFKKKQQEQPLPEQPVVEAPVIKAATPPLSADPEVAAKEKERRIAEKLAQAAEILGKN